MPYVCHPSPGRSYMNGQRGFTLIELMIVVVIVGIIASIAYPSYTRYVQKSMRTDAHAGLMQAASVLERCYTRSYSYAGCNDVPTTSPDGNYDITVDLNSGGGYTLTASTEKNDGCSENITLTARGEKRPDGSEGRPDCW
ncbi:MAG: type IV pilin [Halomonas sp. 54_146]|nr:MAG: type IV pilin [Halomonas sp. 54_146]